MNEKYKKNNTKLKLNVLLMTCIVLAIWLLSIGYAAISPIKLNIKSNVSAVAQDGIFITDVIMSESKNADLVNTHIVNIYKSMLQTNVALSSNTLDTYVKYKIVMHNSTDSNYCFVGSNYEGLYTNDDIKFELQGINEGTVLKAGQNLEFYVIFKYATSTVPSKNVLQSYIDFVFKKAYTVTYENIESTNYTKYAIAEETFSISLGTLDAPIEVKMNGNKLSSSSYTYSNNILKIPNVSGNIHIRKLTKYQITNLVKNGSFENGLNNWTLSGTSGSWGTISVEHYFGSKAAYRVASAEGHNFIRQNIYWTSGHKYYYFGYAIALTKQIFACNVTDKGGKFTLETVSHELRKAATIYTADFTGNNTISVNYAAITDNINIDGIGVVDLTAAFGAGNEPSLSWCNSNIAYFDGTTQVYK